MKKQKKQKKRVRIITVVALVAFGVGMVLSVFGLSQTVVNIDEIAMSKQPEVILASAGVESGEDVNLPVTYFDQRQDACVNLYDADVKTRQFEWTSCDYDNKQIEQGLVEYELGDNYLPVGVGGKLVSNQGLEDMSRWFKNTENKSKEYSGSIKLSYRVGETTEFSFVNNDFYPLDAAEFSAGDGVNKDGHNHLFTMDFAVPFSVTASGDEKFEITADDDTFVFVGTKLALDMGGIHDAIKGRLTINEVGEVYTAIGDEELAYSGIMVVKDSGQLVRIFHADRDAEDGSVFRLKMAGVSLDVVRTQLASGDNGVQVAYDPSDPSYVGPLGESVTLRPDGTKANLIIATILGVVTMTCAVFMAILAHSVIKNRK